MKGEPMVLGGGTRDGGGHQIFDIRAAGGMMRPATETKRGAWDTCGPVQRRYLSRIGEEMAVMDEGH
jgi:hypothetical protein